jgi:hypothetical protein
MEQELSVAALLMRTVEAHRRLVVVLQIKGIIAAQEFQTGDVVFRALLVTVQDVSLSSSAIYVYVF